MEYRSFHTTSVTSRGLLLVGGTQSPNTTELLPTEGGDAVQSFPLEHEMSYHCSISLSPSSFILTGGDNTPNLVTEYSGLDTGEVTTTELPPLIHGRFDHACGTYTSGDTQVTGLGRLHTAPQVLLVTGGYFSRSTEVLPLPGGRWREVADLPSTTWGLRGVSLQGVLHVTGGDTTDGGTGGESPDILAWDPVAEEWALAGQMLEARYQHGVTKIPLSAVASLCSDL